MPVFLAILLWLLCVLTGILLLLWPRFRFLSSYIMLASSLGLLGATVLSIVFILLSGKLLGGTSFAWLPLVGYLTGLILGGWSGIILGCYLARRINRRLGWQP